MTVWGFAAGAVTLASSATSVSADATGYTLPAITGDAVVEAVIVTEAWPVREWERELAKFDRESRRERARRRTADALRALVRNAREPARFKWQSPIELRRFRPHRVGRALAGAWRVRV